MHTVTRGDFAPQKHIPLRSHTRYSTMDALLSPRELVRRAKQWGLPAVAVTDRGNVQAFPALWRAGREFGVKVLYGAELCWAEDGQDKCAGRLTLLVRDREGLKNLYRLISLGHLHHYDRESGQPILPRTLIAQHRAGLLLGSGGWAGELCQAILQNRSQEELERLADFYDYLELMPLAYGQFLVERRDARNQEALREVNRTLAQLGARLHKTVAATGDAYFLDPEEERHRQILRQAKGEDGAGAFYLHTTDELLDEFFYLDEPLCHQAVLDGPQAVADQIEPLELLPRELCLPQLEGGEEELAALVAQGLERLYGTQPPAPVMERLERERALLDRQGCGVLLLAAQRLVQSARSRGYLTGSRGCVGASLVAYLAGVTELDPLPPHYRCPSCKHADFDADPHYRCGADLPDKACPVCGAAYAKEGFDLPVETFLGLQGERLADIDLNFATEEQPRAQAELAELFGADHVLRAGTLGFLSPRTAMLYVEKYLTEHELHVSPVEKARLAREISGVKRATGQHPGGMVIVPRDREVLDFCPVQRPTDAGNTDTLVTHFDYLALQDCLVKLDLLAHDGPSMLHMLEELTGVSIQDEIQPDDADTLALFSSSEGLGYVNDPLLGPTGAVGVPEFGNAYVRQMLEELRPKSVNDLIQLSGLAHGSNVWLDNAQALIARGTAKLGEVAACRDDVMRSLMDHGVERKTAYRIMEDVRKGQVARRGFAGGLMTKLKLRNVPQWYLESLGKIRYLFPRAHVAGYVLLALRVAWFKVHHPLAFYAAYFTLRARDFDEARMTQGVDKARQELQALRAKEDLTALEENALVTWEVCYEFYLRGFRFEGPDPQRSDPTRFGVDQERSALLLPLPPKRRSW